MSLTALQQAVYDRLAADATLSTIAPGGVYDHVPQSTVYPYITLGYAAADNAGTKTEDLREFTFTVNVWSRQRGHKEARTIQERIRTLLHRVALTVSTGHVIDIEEDFSESFLDEDGKTYHGVQRFKALFEAA